MGNAFFFTSGMLAGIIIVALLILAIDPKGVGSDNAHAELCPVMLEHTPTYADSLAVIYEHEGCWEFVHPPAP